MRIERDKLARLLQQATKVVNSRNTIPVLATVRLIAESGRLTVTASNLDIEITGSTECDGDIAACIDAKLLAGIVAKLPSGDIDIETDEGTATIKAGRSRFKLPVLSVDDFPTMETGDFTAEFEADPTALFAPVAFAMSSEETRYYLCGVYLQPTAVTATDGHRLSTMAVEVGAEFEPVIVPAPTVAIAPKGKTTVRLSSRKIQFVTDEATVTSRLIEGTFPDYERVIPKGNDRVVTVDGAALKAAAERVSLVVAIEREVGVKLAIANNEITLSVRGEGEAIDVVPCTFDEPDGPNAEPMVVGFNAKYVVDVINCLPAGEISIALKDGGSPALFTSAAAGGQRVVLMPRRV